MGGDDHAVLDDHVRGFKLGVEQQLVPVAVREVRRGAGEDAAIVLGPGLRAVRVRDPIQPAVDEIDATGLVA